MVQNFYKGLDTYIVYAEDSAFGTPGTPTGSDYVDKVNNFTATITNNFTRVQAIGEGRNASNAVNGVLDVNGNLTWLMTDPDFFQYGFIGVVSGTGTAADPYKITEADEIGYSAGQVKTLTFEAGSNGGANNDVMTYDGCVLNTFTFNANVGEVVNCAADWIGRTGTSSTTLLTYSPPTNRPFTFIDGQIQVNSTKLGEVTQYSMVVNNNFQLFRQVGQRTISQPVAGVRRYEFNLTMKLHKDDASVIDGLKARSIVFDGTTSSTTPTTKAENTAVTMGVVLAEGANTGDRVVNLDFEDVYFESVSTPVAIGDADAGLIEMTISGYALSGLTDSGNKIPVKWYTI